MANHYEVLGISPRATQAEIEDAYRTLLSQYRLKSASADKHQTDSEWLAQRQAYGMLSRPRARLYYNAMHCRLESDWFHVPMDATIGDLQFDADGSFWICREHFSAADPVSSQILSENASFPCTATKAAGATEPLLLAGPGLAQRYQFREGSWYGWMSPVEAVQSAMADTFAGLLDESTIEVQTDKHSESAHSLPELTNRAKSTKRSLIGRIVVAAIIVALVVVGWRANSAQNDRAKPRAKAAAEARSQITTNWNRQGLPRLIGNAQDKLKMYDELLPLAEKWQTIVPPLLSNETGRKLAATPDYVRMMMDEYEHNKGRLSPDAIVALRNRTVKTLATLREAAAKEDAAYKPGDDVEELLGAPGKIRFQIDDYQVSLQLIETLLKTPRAPADKTLAQAIDAMGRARAAVEKQTTKAD